MKTFHRRPRSVYVRAYVRWRFAKLEHVCQHYRSHPNQLELFPH